MIGHIVMLYGIILVLLAGLIFWFLYLGGFLIFAGLFYFIAGIFQKPQVAKREPIRDAFSISGAAGSKTNTGPGWHCTWCWGPLPKGAAFCPTCGKELP